MKAIKLITVLLITLNTIQFSQAQENSLSLKQLSGTWKLDMTPENKDDSNFAVMTITEIQKNNVKGFFYREGVRMTEGRTNTQTGVIYVSLVSSDNSGSYNTTFYLKDGKLYGSTHSIDRDFLAVWTAIKVK